MSTTVNHFLKNRVAVSKDVQKLYSRIQKRTGAVGGYGHNGPVYGEVTMGAFQKVVNFLSEHTEFGPESSFIDIGAGLGKPNLHVAVDPGVQLSYGVELEELRWQLSMHNLRACVNEVNHNVYFEHCDVTSIGHFEPFTHVYMFDVGFPPAALVSIANAFNVSRSAKALVSFQRPLHIIKTYGFEVTLIGKVQTRMCGSSEGHTAYVYQSTRNASAGTATATGLKAEEEGKEQATLGEFPIGPDNETTDEPKSKSSPRKRRTQTLGSPMKRRRQQTQLDKDFFPVTTPSTKTTSVEREKPGSAKVLFPLEDDTILVGETTDQPTDRGSRTRRPRIDTSRPDPLVQTALSILEVPEAYADWVESTGRIGDPGTRSERKHIKRVLFSAS